VDLHLIALYTVIVK